MNRVLGFVLDHKLLVTLVTAVVVVLGLASAGTLSREAYPNASLNIIVVSATLPGASPSDVESKLTLPIEAAVKRIDGVDSYRSISSENLSHVEVSLHDELDEEQLKMHK